MHVAFGRVRRKIAQLRVSSFLLMTGVYLEMVLGVCNCSYIRARYRVNRNVP